MPSSYVIPLITKLQNPCSGAIMHINNIKKEYALQMCCICPDVKAFLQMKQKKI